MAESPSSLTNSDAIVVGSGLAGLSASYQLVGNNVRVHLLERASKPGGNSMKASSGINGAPTQYQPLPDSAFFDDTIRSVGKALSTNPDQRKKLIEILTNSSSAAISWLVEKGIDLSKVSLLGGHSHPRTHRGHGKTPPGAAIVTSLLNTLNSSPLFDLKIGCEVIKVLKDKNGVSGVEFVSDGKAEMLHGPVVFASGGFAGDPQGMLAQYRPDLTGFPSTNELREGSQPLLTSVGADLIDMDMVQVHPTGFVDPKNPSSPLKFLAAEVLRGEGGLLLLDGKRFVNEMETREHIMDTIVQVPAMDISPRQWDIKLVLDEGSYNAVSSHVDFYLWKGLMRKTTVAELGLDALSTLQEYANIVSGRVDDSFGRSAFGHFSTMDFDAETVVYTGRVTPVVHFTMGGVVINEQSEVLDVNGKSIPGLWAAGEVTGGIHGENRLGGSSLLECVVFGCIAGDQAAAVSKDRFSQ